MLKHNQKIWSYIATITVTHTIAISFLIYTLLFDINLLSAHQELLSEEPTYIETNSKFNIFMASLLIVGFVVDAVTSIKKKINNLEWKKTEELPS